MTRKQDEKKKKSLHPEYARFLDFKSRRIKPGSINTMTRRFARFPEPDGLTREYFEKRMGEVAPRTVKYELIMAKAFLKWAKRDFSHLQGFDVGKMEETVTVDDLYTPEELRAIFEAAEPIRNRPMLQVLYESACRAGELVSMTYESVRPGEVPNTFEVLVDGKTGKREVVLIDSAPALKTWLEAHPIKRGPLWMSAKRDERGEYRALSETGLYLVAQGVLKDAKVTGKKRILHMFRHTRITAMHREGWQGLSLHGAVGWAPGSSMEKVYVHLDNSQIKSRWYQVRGLAPENGQPVAQQTPIKCEREGCGYLNDYTRKFCSECGFPLTEELKAKFRKDDLTERLATLEGMQESLFLVLSKYEGKDLEQMMREAKEDFQERQREQTKTRKRIKELDRLIDEEEEKPKQKKDKKQA